MVITWKIHAMQNNLLKALDHWTGQDQKNEADTFHFLSIFHQLPHPQAGQTLTEERLEIGFLWAGSDHQCVPPWRHSHDQPDATYNNSQLPSQHLCISSNNPGSQFKS